MHLNLALSIEQQFNLRKYREELASLDHDAKDKIIMGLLQQLYTSQNVNKQLIKQLGELEFGGINKTLNKLEQ